MATVGIFFGSDTGNTEHVAKQIQKELGKNLLEVHDIAKSSKEDIAAFDLLLFKPRQHMFSCCPCDLLHQPISTILLREPTPFPCLNLAAVVHLLMHDFSFVLGYDNIHIFLKNPCRSI